MIHDLVVPVCGGPDLRASLCAFCLCLFLIFTFAHACFRFRSLISVHWRGGCVRGKGLEIVDGQTARWLLLRQMLTTCGVQCLAYVRRMNLEFMIRDLACSRFPEACVVHACEPQASAK